MKNTLKEYSPETVIETLKKLDELEPIKIERLNNALKVSVNVNAFSEDYKIKKTEELINHILLLFALERESFDHFLCKNISLNNFILTYRRVFQARYSKGKVDEYVNNILGEKPVNSYITVYIKENNYRDKPVFCEISHREGYKLKEDKRYSEEEILNLIKLKKIVVRYPNYIKDKKEHFFCAIEDCLDLNDDKIISFTLENYPFIYEDLKSSLDVTTINNGREDFKNNRELVLIGILNYFNRIKKTDNDNSKNAYCLAKRCISSIKRLNNPN